MSCCRIFHIALISCTHIHVMLPALRRRCVLLRPLLRAPLLRLYSFFAPNLDRDPASQLDQAAAFVASRRVFLDPNAFYPQVEITDPSIMETALENTFEPYRTWLEIAKLNACAAAVGSFVEFQRGPETQFGVVLREPAAKFNHFHNSLVVLNLDNELVRVYPQDITFSAFQVLDPDWITSLNILRNRFDDAFASRVRLVQILHQFVAAVQSNGLRVKRDLQSMAYPHISATAHAAPTSLVQIAQLISGSDTSASAMPSYLAQSALLMALHLEMCHDMHRWMVPGCVPAERRTNIAAHGISNELPPVQLYFANSVLNMSSVADFMSYSQTQMEGLDRFLKHLLTSQQAYDNLVLSFSIWEGHQYRSALVAMKFALIYPHTHLTNKLSQLLVLEGCSQRTLRKILTDIGIYDNPQNPLTDPLLSANMAGKMKETALAAFSSQHLLPSETQAASDKEISAGKLTDHFPHLRRKKYYLDHVIYILPGKEWGLGISLEKVSSRKYMVNLHIPDVAARLSPSSLTFASWSSNSAFLDSMGLANVFKAESAADILLKQNSIRRKPDYYSVGESFVEKQAEPGVQQTCMTLSFEFHTYETSPLEDLRSNVSVRFDTIDNLEVKYLDEKLLERTLTGKLEPSILGSFKLFNNAASKSLDSPLRDSDHYNINFIYNIMRRHFINRNRNYAVNADPDIFFKQVSKTLSIEDTESDAVSTDIQIESREEARKHARSSFFKNELNLFAGALAAAYATREQIPIIRRVQGLLPLSSEDQVFLHHNNSLMPNFSATSYYEIAFARDAAGYVSPAAYFFSTNYLGERELLALHGDSEETLNVALGLKDGFVSVVEAWRSMEAYINQLQLLAHLQFAAQSGKLHGENNREFLFLKGLGYSLHGPLPEASLQAQLEKLKTGALGSEFLRNKRDRFWKLRAVEQTAEKFTSFTCIVLRLAPEMETLSKGDTFFSIKSPRIVCAYCEELAIEVHVSVRPDTDATIGAVIYASEILYVDSSEGECVLGEA